MQKSCIQGPPNAKWKWNDGTNNRQGCLRLSGIHQLCNVEKISAPAFQSGTKQKVNVSWPQLEYKAELEWLQYRAITMLHQKCQKSSGEKFHQVGSITPCPYLLQTKWHELQFIGKAKIFVFKPAGPFYGEWSRVCADLIQSCKECQSWWVAQILSLWGIRLAGSWNNFQWPLPANWVPQRNKIWATHQT